MDDSGRRTTRAGGRLGPADDSGRRTTGVGGRLGPADDSGRRTTRAGGRLGPADDLGLYRLGPAIPADDLGRRAGPVVKGERAKGEKGFFGS